MGHSRSVGKSGHVKHDSDGVIGGSAQLHFVRFGEIGSVWSISEREC